MHDETLSKLGIEVSSINSIKYMCKKLTANGEKPEAFPLRLGTRHDVPPLLLFNIILEDSANAVRKENESVYRLRRKK